MSEVLVTVSDATAKSLQELIRLNVDSAEGFTAAAGIIDDKRIAELFREYATQRTSNAEELKASVAFNGEEPASSGTTSGTLHRWWLELRSTVAGGSAAQVLTEAERGEDAIKKAYEGIIREVAGSPIADLLMTQFRGVKAAHDHVRDLRDAYKAAK
ncbi:MAG TPA: PA2169 family four-helix-bundle protein [Tepidisphaeraceae bacterium]|jgi:uncharacterized protein (TIGR02284 family)